MASWSRRKGRRWKGVPWINTRYAIPYKRRMWAARAMAAGQFSVALAQSRLIASSGGGSPAEKVVAICRAYTHAVRAANELVRRLIETKAAAK